MSREDPGNIHNFDSASESFHDDGSFDNQLTPFSSVQGVVLSPDVEKKVCHISYFNFLYQKLLSNIRYLTFKVTELQNCCDDLESEKRELLRIKLDCERKISLLEGKCRAKERELDDLRDSWNELQLCRVEIEKIKLENDRQVIYIYHFFVSVQLPH